ncbi:MAG: hypothetical protein QF473_20915 [Planctomycetota bacterium]|jgi:hypothetical protein|nr:hypothetical protein [Planctomycetota bacterium]MDP6506263.1 hypothetical protein [Planctomycetota bacterium]
MDTRAGYVKFAFFKTRKIDLVKLGKIIDGAGYTLKKLELEVKGDIAESETEKGRYELKLETGQTFYLEGTHSPKTGVLVKGEVQGWDTWTPKIKNLKEVGA